MQQTVQQVESKTSLLGTKAQSLKLSLERVVTTAAATAADNYRLREEAKRHLDSTSHSFSSHTNEVNALRSEVAQSKAELKDAIAKVTALREEAEKKEVKHSELKRSNDELQKENQSLQKQLNEIKTTPRPDANGHNAKTSPSVSPPVTPTTRAEDSSAKLSPGGEKEVDGTSQPASKSPTPRQSTAITPGGEITPRATTVTKAEPGNISNFRSVTLCMAYETYRCNDTQKQSCGTDGRRVEETPHHCRTKLSEAVVS